MANPTTTDELEAVNVMLAAIGELPTTQTVLTAGSSADVAMAVQILGEVNKEVQAEGWHFNNDYAVEYEPSDPDGWILVPANVVRFTVAGLDVTVRYDSGVRKLYNKAGNTYVFTSTIEARNVYMFEFEQVPEVAKRYITVRAARIFQDRVVGSTSAHQMSQQDEMKALLNLREYEGSMTSPTIFDSLGTFNVIKRGSAL